MKVDCVDAGAVAGSFDDAGSIEDEFLGLLETSKSLEEVDFVEIKLTLDWGTEVLGLAAFSLYNRINDSQFQNHKFLH